MDDGGASADRRQLTIVFSDISQSTRIAAAMEAEDYSDLLKDLRAIYAEAVARHGGEIVRIDGDGVAIIFGYPTTHEDDGRRATETALDLHAAARRLTIDVPGMEPGLRLHTGVNSGLVLVKEGDLVRGRFEMLGDATHVAKRLADMAKPDEILVSEASLEAEKHFFHTSNRRLVTPRGMNESMAVLSVLGRAETQTRFDTRVRLGLTPFKGRLTELARMEQWLGEARAGIPRLGVVVGPPGLGKTRLVDRFLSLASTPGLQIHRGYCESYLGARPLQPFLQLLWSVFRIDPSTAPDQVDERVSQVARRVGPDLMNRLRSLQGGAGERSAPSATESAILLRELFERLAEDGPLVLFIDDWQWADDISRQALDQIHAIENRSILLLLATREYGAVEARMSGAELIELAPLSPEDALATARAKLPPSEPFMIERVAKYSGGNPLFIEEMCHAISRGDGEPRPDSRGGWLDTLIESRFSRLPEEQARLVRAASVIGHIVPVWLFEEITGRAKNDPILLDLETQDFIYRSELLGSLRFKHGLTRDAIYHKVGLRERRALHLRVAQALRRNAAVAGQEEPFEALSYHYGAGGDYVQAAHHAEIAGEKAMAVSSLDRAQAQYRAALTALESVEATDETVERWNAIIKKYGLASVFDPSRDQLPIFQRAATTAAIRGDVGALAAAEYWLGYIYYGLGQARKSIIHGERALKAAVQFGDDKLRVQIRATLGQAHAAAGDYMPALSLLDEAIAIKAHNSRGLRASIGLAYSLSCKGFVLADQGRFDEAHALFDEAMDALCGETHEVAASLLTQRSAACLWEGRLEDAAFYAAEGERVSERVKARYMFSMSRALAAYARWRADRDPQALQTMVEATTWLEASESRQFLSLNYGWLTEAMVEVGEIAQARGYAARALRRARQGDRVGEAMAMRALARAAHQGHGRRPAQAYLIRAMASAEARGSAHEAASNQRCADGIALGGDGLTGRPKA